MSSLIPFFQWCDNSMIGSAIRNSRVAFPIIENFHLFALTVLLGTIVVLCLRQFGLVLKNQPFGDVLWQYVFPREDDFPVFCPALPVLCLQPIGAGEQERAPIDSKIAAGVALFLWFGVGLVAARSVSWDKETRSRP